MRRWLWKSFFCFFILTCITGSQKILLERSRASILDEKTCETAAFREQHLPTELYQQLRNQDKSSGNTDWIENLTTTMLNGKFYPRECFFEREAYLRYKYKEYTDLCSLYRAVWKDVRYFPVAADDISFEDGWMEERSFGGERVHEGCDLFGDCGAADFYPIISMTDGNVEAVGWLPLGGYRIGIRSPSGGYFYYAHLSSYERDWKEGDSVEAGEILGFMGDTGYGVEGTRGKFPVHLHLGIYIQTPYSQEMSVNPYWVLKAVLLFTPFTVTWSKSIPNHLR